VGLVIIVLLEIYC